MIEPRIYRAAFVPAVLAVVLVMFSLESRPRPLPQGLAADVLFDGGQAASGAREIVERARDRRSGSAGDAALAGAVRVALSERGFAVEVDRFDRDGRALVNVVGRRAGQSPRQIVVLAARDASGVPDAAGSAADTAALLELSRVFEGRPSRKTLVLASVDGSTLGQVGARRLAERLEDPDLVDAVLVLSDLGSGAREPPSIVPWSNDVTRAGIGLQRTVAESLRQEIGRPAAGASPTGQGARLAFPIGIGAQGPLIAAGYDAVRIAGDGELEGSGDSEPDAIDEDRLGGLGRATLRTVTALDQGGRPAHGPSAYVTVGGQVLPGWVLVVLGLTLILPALVASIDAFARARRRARAISPWFAWVGAGGLAFAVGLGLAHVLALSGATPDPPAAPVTPDLYPLRAAGWGVLGVLATAIALAWVGLRRIARRVAADVTDPGAAVAVALVLSVSVLGVWALNPYSVLILVPALHLWILATLVDPPPARRTRLIMVAAGLLLPVLLVTYDLITLQLDPASGAWYLFLLVTGGHVSVVSALLGCVLAAALGSVAAIAGARHPEAEGGAGDTPSVRGPGSYAGPGSLGGTSSALRR
ncbi:MAG: hypothetical protein ACR2GL_07945 [Thermoleophilaceae bacterium]